MTFVCFLFGCCCQILIRRSPDPFHWFGIVRFLHCSHCQCLYRNNLSGNRQIRCRSIAAFTLFRFQRGRHCAGEQLFHTFRLVFIRPICLLFTFELCSFGKLREHDHSVLKCENIPEQPHEVIQRLPLGPLLIHVIIRQAVECVENVCNGHLSTVHLKMFRNEAANRRRAVRMCYRCPRPGLFWLSRCCIPGRFSGFRKNNDRCSLFFQRSCLLFLFRNRS